MLVRARQFLVAREEKHTQESSPINRLQHAESARTRLHSVATTDHNRAEGRRRSISNFLFRRGTVLESRSPGTIRESSLEGIPDNQGYR